MIVEEDRPSKDEFDDEEAKENKEDKEAETEW
jgi:hypothetical protein